MFPEEVSFILFFSKKLAFKFMNWVKQMALSSAGRHDPIHWTLE